MRRNILSIRTLLFFLLLTVVLTSYGQDTTVKNVRNILIYSIRVQSPFYYLQHWPGIEDNKNIETYGYLKSQLPDSNNYEKYFSLACSFWNLNRTQEAEKMFLVIMKSKDKYYTTTDYHSSGTTYGYGSYSTNYKNYAAVYLTKIYIEKNKFDKALSYLEDAVKKYEVSFGCGTGHHRQQEEYDFLYASIYEGQKHYDKVMDLLLPECLTRNDKIIVRTIKNIYSIEQIKEKLHQAENSMQFVLDTEPSFSYTTRNYGYSNARNDTSFYYSGSATINLFNKEVNIPTPNLKNGERITKEHFLKAFRETAVYENLTKQ